MTWRGVSTTIGSAVVAVILSTVTVTPQARGAAIVGVSIVDVADGRILPNNTVTISGARVTPIGAAA